MTTSAKQVNSPRKVAIPRVITGMGYFLLHLLEMCAVMCMGGLAPLSVLLRWVGPLIGYPAFKEQLPELSAVLLAVWLTVVMILWMRIRRHEWRLTLEMASTSVIALPIVMTATWLGAIPRTSLYGLECGVACVLMVVPMLLRLGHYSGSHASHQNHMHAAPSTHDHSHHTS